MDIINTKLIDLDIQLPDKESVIRKLALTLEQEERLIDYGEYIREVMRREELTSTGIGFGIAIPHGKSAAVKIPSVALGRLAQPIEWQSLDDQPVQLVFLLAVPEEAAGNQHLRVLAALSRKLLDDEFRQKLLTNTDADCLLALLSDLFVQALR